LSFGKGGTDAFAQASLLNLYDPDRSKKFLKVGNASTRSAALGGLKALVASFKETREKDFISLSSQQVRLRAIVLK
jgi:hypothetical protein